MPNKLVIIASSVLVAWVLSLVTFLIARDKDVTDLVDAVPNILIAIAALYAGSQASKANVKAGQAVTNTNGNMNRLITLLEKNGIQVNRAADGTITEVDYSGEITTSDFEGEGS